MKASVELEHVVFLLLFLKEQASQLLFNSIVTRRVLGLQSSSCL